MKKILPLIAFMLFGMLASGQSRQEDTASKYIPIVPTEKQTRLKNVDMIMNMQYNFRSDFYDGENTANQFKFEQVRFEIKGYVAEKVYFRFRHRYTSTFEPQTIDKIIKGVDFAYIRLDLSKKTQLTIGKTFADWGGWEFDLNPIDIYEYSDIIEQADNFLTGVGIYHQLTKNHGLSFQILDSRTSSFTELYPRDTTITPSNTPLAAVINWRGSFFGGKVTTLWSYSLFNEAKGFYKNYIALGQQFNSDKWTVMYDFKISDEDLDRTGIITADVPDALFNFSVRNTLYYSHWTRFTYKFNRQWRLSLDAFVDYADWKGDADPQKTEDRFKTTYSAIPTVEFFPWADVNLKFFAGYVYRDYMYSDYAKTRVGAQDYTKGRFIIGFISPLQIL